MSTLGLKMLSAVIHSGSITDFKEVVLDHLKPTEQLVFEYVEQHILEYGAVPKKSTVQNKTGITLPKFNEPLLYYKEEVECRFLTAQVNETMMRVQDSISSKDPHEAMSFMADSVASMMQGKAGSGLVDFRNAQQLMKLHHKKKLFMGHFGVKTGWDYLDNRMGGLEGGDVMSVVGRPAQGKTFLLLYMAQHAWMYQDKTPLVVTPEMKPMKLMERLTAMYTKTALTPIANAEWTPQSFKKKVLDKMEGLKTGKYPFWIIDGAECQTIEDLFLLCRQLKPSCVYYDGAYLMKHKNKRLSKWERIAETASGLKDVSSYLDIPVVASYQFGKDAVKKKKGKQASLPGLEDIYGSDEIAQLSSVVLGLMGDDNISNVTKKICTLLKGRGGERGQWAINWLFHNMNFDELLPDNKVQGKKKELGNI